jgi:hypothetical protein
MAVQAVSEMKSVKWDRAESVKWKVFSARISGVTPLLMNNPVAMRGNEPAARRKDREYPPEEEAKVRLYVSPDGYLALNADHVRSCMLKAAEVARLKFQKSALKPRLAGGLKPIAEWFPLMRGDSFLSTYDRIDLRRVVVQKQGVIRARPLIDVPWCCEVIFLFDAATVSAAAIAQTLELGGQIVGLLDYRPQKGGMYGRFTVEEAFEAEV